MRLHVPRWSCSSLCLAFASLALEANALARQTAAAAAYAPRMRTPVERASGTGSVPCLSADVRTLGSASHATGGRLRLHLNGSPIVGNAFELRVSGGAPGSVGWLFAGPKLVPTFVSGSAFIRVPAGTRQVAFGLDGSGTSPALLEQVPVSSAMCGRRWMAQAIALEPMASGGTAATNGLALDWGPRDGAFLFAVERYDVGGQTNTVRVGDMNGDGHPDAVATTGQPSIEVLLGSGNGRLADPIPTALPGVGTNVMPFELGDVDGDGDLDVVRLDVIRDRVEVYLGTGDGSLTPGAAYELPGAYALALAHFDANGTLDLALTSTNEAVVEVWLGSGDGTFARETVMETGPFPFLLAPADFDGDGLVDLAVACNRQSPPSHQLWVFRSIGEGDLALFGVEILGDSMRSLAAADLDEDGWADVVTTSDRDVVRLLGRGDGTFQRATYLTSGDVTWVAIGDVDEDDALDVLYRSEGATEDKVGLLPEAGIGNLEAAWKEEYHDAGFSPQLEDLNGDGALDVVLANGFADTVAVHPGRGDGTLHLPEAVQTWGLPGRIALGDFNDDERWDVAYVDDYNGTTLWQLRGLASGKFTALGPVSTCFRAVASASGRFDSDARTDLALACRESDEVWIHRGPGFSNAASYPAGSDPVAILAHDVDGDGALDLAVGNLTDELTILAGFGDGTFSVPTTSPSVRNPIALGAADLNEDGLVDLVVTGIAETGVHLASAPGTYGAPAALFPAMSGGNVDGVALGDFDEDGHVDFAIASRGDQLTTFRGLGDGTFEAPVSLSTGDGPVFLASADVNGDRHLDLIVASEYDRDVTVHLGRGDGSFGPLRRFATGTEPSMVALRDTDGDQVPELVVGSSDIYAHDRVYVIRNLLFGR